MNNNRVLVVDDEFQICEIVSLYLQKEGYEVYTALQGNQGLEYVRRYRPTLIILDIQLPDDEGFAICLELRKMTDVPIIFLSCRQQYQDKVIGLEAGADDYVTKPFSPSELIARVNAHIRRYRHLKYNAADKQTLLFPGLEIDLTSYQVFAQGQEVALSTKEFNLLRLLAQHPNRVFSLFELFDQVWQMDNIGDVRTVMVHISTLRKKIEPNPAQPRYILTVRGVGYKFNQFDN